MPRTALTPVRTPGKGTAQQYALLARATGVLEQTYTSKWAVIMQGQVHQTQQICSSDGSKGNLQEREVAPAFPATKV